MIDTTSSRHSANRCLLLAASAAQEVDEVFDAISYCKGGSISANMADVCVCVILSTNSICPPALLLPTSLEAETHSTKGYTICWFPFAKVL